MLLCTRSLDTSIFRDSSILLLGSAVYGRTMGGAVRPIHRRSSQSATPQAWPMHRRCAARGRITLVSKLLLLRDHRMRAAVNNFVLDHHHLCAPAVVCFKCLLQMSMFLSSRRNAPVLRQRASAPLNLPQVHKLSLLRRLLRGRLGFLPLPLLPPILARSSSLSCLLGKVVVTFIECSAWISTPAGQISEV